MYIPEFWVGVASTVLAEIATILVVSFINRKKGE